LTVGCLRSEGELFKAMHAVVEIFETRANPDRVI
jgi:hypothetical protein